MTKTTDELIESYDRIAERYASEFFDELAQKPFEREVLDRFAAGVREGGSVLDIGCGPGQTVRYLKDRGLAIRGMDLSEGMLVTARERNPDVTFERHDFRCTGLADDSLAGIVGFYALACLAYGGVYRPKGVDLGHPAFYALIVIALCPVFTWWLERRRRVRPHGTI